MEKISKTNSLRGRERVGVIGRVEKKKTLIAKGRVGF